MCQAQSTGKRNWSTAVSAITMNALH
jgi:hypothetical protein